jgi:hypothetical protein
LSSGVFPTGPSGATGTSKEERVRTKFAVLFAATVILTSTAWGAWTDEVKITANRDSDETYNTNGHKVVFSSNGVGHVVWCGTKKKNTVCYARYYPTFRLDQGAGAQHLGAESIHRSRCRRHDHPRRLVGLQTRRQALLPHFLPEARTGQLRHRRLGRNARRHSPVSYEEPLPSESGSRLPSRDERRGGCLGGVHVSDGPFGRVPRVRLGHVV